MYWFCIWIIQNSLSIRDWQYCSLVYLRHLGLFFVGPRSFSHFSAQGSEKGGEAEPTQKATLFPSGSALHPTMNGVLKNITLGTRLFFIPHNWAICPRVSSGCWYNLQNETAMVLQYCACYTGVKKPTSQLGAQWHLYVPLVFWDNATVQW